MDSVLNEQGSVITVQTDFSLRYLWTAVGWTLAPPWAEDAPDARPDAEKNGSFVLFVVADAASGGGCYCRLDLWRHLL
jgi:hypothetical protein